VSNMKKGYKIGNTNFKVHLDGFNLMPFLAGKEKCPREGFLYWSDEGDILAVRAQNWKVVFAEQRNTGIGVWREAFTKMRSPKLFNLRSDPFEAGDSSILYDRWFAERAFVMVPAQALVAQWIESFKEFPPRAKSASWSIDRVVEAMMPKD